MVDQNQISVEQNSTKSQELLAAICHYYGRGKIALAVQMILTIGLAVVLALLTRFFPDFKVWATFIAVTITWLDVVFIDRIQIHYRKKGALAQEMLDTHLFQLNWNELRCNKRLINEEIHSAGEDFKSKHATDRLKDWYPVAARRVSLPLARFICQRSCLWWETSQRDIYHNWLIGGGTVMLIFTAVVALCGHMTFEDAILSTYVPIAPALIWAFREARRQKDASDSLARARGHVENVWKSALARPLDTRELEIASRQVQDVLFDNRCKNPLIFDWIYKRLKPKRERAMAVNAEAMVAEATQS